MEAPFTEDDIASLSAGLLEQLVESRAAAYGLEVSTPANSSESVACVTIAACPEHLVADTTKKVRDHLEKLGFAVLSAQAR